MYLLILLAIVVVLLFTTGSGESFFPEKLVKFLRYYKLDATKYLQKKFNVTGRGKALIKKICDKYLIDSREKFIKLSGLCQKVLLPADKVEFLEASSYVPSELEYQVLERLFPGKDVYELWRRNRHFKLKDNLVRAKLARIKKIDEPFEIDIVPFYGMVQDKDDTKWLEYLMGITDATLRARLLMAILRGKGFGENLDYLKDLERFARGQRDAESAETEAQNQAIIDYITEHTQDKTIADLADQIKTNKPPPVDNDSEKYAPSAPEMDPHENAPPVDSDFHLYDPEKFPIPSAPPEEDTASDQAIAEALQEELYNGGGEVVLGNYEKFKKYIL